MELVYPVFKVGTETPIQENGVSLYLREYLNEEENKLVYRHHIIDDKNISGASLAIRRLKLKTQGVPLKRLNNAVFFLGDLIKIAKPSVWMIDSSGTLFQYKKTVYTKLEFEKIKIKHNIPSGGCILELEGIPTRFKTLYNLSTLERYAGVIRHKMQYILYGVYKTLPEKNTWRMI